jgi:hypothetical protein
MNNFELKKFLVENKLTTNSRTLKGDFTPSPNNSSVNRDDIKEDSNLPVDNPKVEIIIQMLKDIDVDGETMQYILTQVDMEDQMQSQLDSSSEFDDKFKGFTPDDIDF